MPDLEPQISAWRSQMLAAGIQSPVPLDELESHLRDDIAEQLKSGLGEAEAFQTAIQKLGHATTLKKEFVKAREARTARFLVVVLVPAFVSLFSMAMAALLVFKIGSFAEVNPVQKLSGLAAAAAMAIFGWSGLLAQRLFPVISNKRAREVICAGGAIVLVLWWSSFFYLVLPRSEFVMGGLCVAIIWGFALPFGLLAGLIAGLEKAAGRQMRQGTVDQGQLTADN